MVIRTQRLAALALCFTLPISALAQSAAPPEATTEATMPAAKAKHRHGGAMHSAGLAARQDRHLAELRAQLQITPAQQPQWEAFAKASRDNATELHQRFAQRRTQLAAMTAADNMADFAQISELHAQELGRLAQAFRALYASLTPEQQKGADAAFRQGHAPMGGRHG